MTLPAAVLDAMVSNSMIDRAVSDFLKDWMEKNGGKSVDGILNA